MAGSKSNYLSLALLDHVLGKSRSGGGFTYSAPTTVYLGLWITGLNDTASGVTAGEPGSNGNGAGASAYGYARVAVTNNAANWPDAAGGGTAEKHNGAAITFGSASGGDWGTVTQFALLDAGPTSKQAANILYWSDLTTSKTIAAGDTASFGIGAISITEN